jgi:hypothetical protein
MAEVGELYRRFLEPTQRTQRLHKWHHYFPVYERFIAPFRGRRVTLLEIGVQQGGLLELWRAYLGPAARIVGIDMNYSIQSGGLDEVS